MDLSSLVQNLDAQPYMLEGLEPPSFVLQPKQ